MSQSDRNITIEFFGIARQRAGIEQVVFRLARGANSIQLGELLEKLAAAHPGLAGECVAGGKLGAGCAANLDGDRFVRAPETSIRAGQTLMLLSADAGG